MIVPYLYLDDSVENMIIPYLYLDAKSDVDGWRRIMNILWEL